MPFVLNTPDFMSWPEGFETDISLPDLFPPIESLVSGNPSNSQIADFEVSSNLLRTNSESNGGFHQSNIACSTPRDEGGTTDAISLADQGNFVGSHAEQSSTMLCHIDLETDLNEAGHQQSARLSMHRIDVPSFVAMDLINEFLEHVHCCIPLFHSNNIRKRFEYLQESATGVVDGLSLESALLLNGMFSLSARFSGAQTFKSENRLRRGERFLQEATRLYELSAKQLQEDNLSLELLQGIILLTFSTLQLGPTRQARLLCGVCARLAYELGLHNTDADVIAGIADETYPTDVSWSEKEERRRAWWVVWDMDTFANSVAFTPFSLDLRHANVLLPMPDEAWLQSRKVSVTYLVADSPSPWMRLSDSPNQSSWAWFLAGTTILRQVLDIVSCPQPQTQDLDQVEACANCFAMILPETFQLESISMSFDESNFGEMNWIVSTLMMLQAYASLISNGISVSASCYDH
jgi:Fungal specific transcription factor domain